MNLHKIVKNTTPLSEQDTVITESDKTADDASPGTFFGINHGTKDHVDMTKAAKRLKRTNPKLYQKLINLD